MLPRLNLDQAEICVPQNPAIVVGLLVMMWPVLTKVQYERLPEITRERRLWYQIGISLILNWLIGEWVWPVWMRG